MKVLITGADRGLGLFLTEKMLKRHYTVFAGQYMPEHQELNDLQQQFPETLHLIPLDVGSDESVKNARFQVEKITDQLDVLIGNAAIIGWNDHIIRKMTDTQMMADVYNVNAIGNVRVVEHFLPLLEAGSERKICLVSSEAGSIGECERDNFFWYAMTKSALNQYAKIMFNRHRPDGFKFRLYQPGWMKTHMRGYVDTHADLTPERAASLAADYLFDKEINEDELVLWSYEGRKMAF